MAQLPLVLTSVLTVLRSAQICIIELTMRGGVGSKTDVLVRRANRRIVTFVVFAELELVQVVFLVVPTNRPFEIGELLNTVSRQTIFLFLAIDHEALWVVARRDLATGAAL